MWKFAGPRPSSPSFSLPVGSFVYQVWLVGWPSSMAALDTTHAARPRVEIAAGYGQALGARGAGLGMLWFESWSRLANEPRDVASCGSSSQISEAARFATMFYFTSALCFALLSNSRLAFVMAVTGVNSTPLLRSLARALLVLQMASLPQGLSAIRYCIELRGIIANDYEV